MTYCVAMRLEQGMIFAADSRTNAGVDHIATFRKLHRFEREGERLIVLMTALVKPFGEQKQLQVLEKPLVHLKRVF